MSGQEERTAKVFENTSALSQTGLDVNSGSSIRRVISPSVKTERRLGELIELIFV